MKVVKFLLAMTLLYVSHSSYALRCGHDLVTPGDYKHEVIEKCGEPDYFDSHWERRGNINHADVYQPLPYGYGYNRRQLPQSSLNFGQAYYQEEEVLIEEWTYDFGRRRFYQHLTFENGKLKSVQSGRRSRR